MSVFVAEGKSITHLSGFNGVLGPGDNADCLAAEVQKDFLQRGLLTKEDVKAKQAAAKQAAAVKAEESAAKEDVKAKVVVKVQGAVKATD